MSPPNVHFAGAALAPAVESQQNRQNVLPSQARTVSGVGRPQGCILWTRSVYPKRPQNQRDVSLLSQVRSEGGETAPKLVGPSPGRVQDLRRPDGAGPRCGVSGLFNSDLPTSRGRPGAHWMPNAGSFFPSTLTAFSARVLGFCPPFSLKRAESRPWSQTDTAQTPAPPFSGYVAQSRLPL